MNARWKDFDGDENRFLHQLGTRAEQAEASHRRCPAPDMILAAYGDAMPMELREPVLQHLAICRCCAALARDLADPDLANPQPLEEKRIQDRLRGGIEQPPRWRAFHWRWSYTLATAAVILAVVLGFSTRGRRQPDRRPSAATPAPPPVEVVTAFRLEKAPIELAPTTLLIQRGATPQPARDRLLADLNAALEPYRQNDFLAARQQLQRFTETHPRVAEGYLFLGVSELFLHQDSAAVKTLGRARIADTGAFADRISWYLVLACKRTGDDGCARTQVTRLCKGTGEYSARACNGLRELESTLPVK